MSGLETLKLHGLIDQNILKMISHFEGVKHLCLSGGDIQHTEIHVLQKLRLLESLTLTNLTITDDHFVQICKLTRLKQIGVKFVDGFTNKSMEGLTNLINLSRIDLSDTLLVNDTGIQYLQNLSNMTIILVHGLSITDESLYVISQLEKIKELDLSCCQKITVTGLRQLHKLKHLEKVDLTGCWSIGRRREVENAIPCARVII